MAKGIDQTGSHGCCHNKVQIWGARTPQIQELFMVPGEPSNLYSICNTLPDPSTLDPAHDYALNEIALQDEKENHNWRCHGHRRRH